MKLSFVVSTFNRPCVLPVVLHALAIQTMSDFEVIVADNSQDFDVQADNRKIAESLGPRFWHVDTVEIEHDGPIFTVPDCYTAAEWVVRHRCRGEFICFPSDDSYYVPVFAELMLNAAEKNNWDLVYCNMVYDARFNGQHYAAINVQPVVDCIDKTGFILRRSWFEGFPGKVKDGPCKSDGMLIESLIKRGISHGKIQDVLLVHN